MIFFWDRRVDIGFGDSDRFGNGGCTDIDLFAFLLDLISRRFHRVVVRKSICCPINDGVKHFEPRMSEDYSITSYVSDIEAKGL
jgi:hypothetical protein